MALDEAGKVRVSWNKPAVTAGTGQVVTGYSVQYKRKGTSSYITHAVPGSSTTSYTIADLDLGTVYEVRVAAEGPLGLSGYCSGKVVTTLSSEYILHIHAISKYSYLLLYKITRCHNLQPVYVPLQCNHHAECGHSWETYTPSGLHAPVFIVHACSAEEFLAHYHYNLTPTCTLE